MARKSVTEPIADEVKVEEVAKTEVVEPAEPAQSNEEVASKVITVQQRILELQLMVDGAKYRKQNILAQADAEAKALQEKVTKAISSIDELIASCVQEIKALSETKEATND